MLAFAVRIIFVFIICELSRSISSTLLGRIYPFTLGVYFNDNEECTAATGAAATCETDTLPGGITGFALNFVQQSC